jgi:DDE superfamily endonuclease
MRINGLPVGMDASLHRGEQLPPQAQRLQEPLYRDAYHSYKNRISMLLLAIVDSQGRFLWTSSGSPGSHNDAGVWARCPLRNENIVKDGLLRRPEVQLQLANGEAMRVKPFLVGDGAFVLSAYMMKCYDNDTPWSRRISATAFAMCDMWLSRRLKIEDFAALMPNCLVRGSEVWAGLARFVEEQLGNGERPGALARLH